MNTYYLERLFMSLHFKFPSLTKCPRLIDFFLANIIILYPLKTPENLWVFSIFKGYKTGILTREMS